MQLRFAPNRGKWVVDLPCAVAFEYVDNDVLMDDVAEGVGQVWMNHGELTELVGLDKVMEGKQAWLAPDGDSLLFTPMVESRGGFGWTVARPNGTGFRELTTPSQYAKFISLIRNRGYRHQSEILALSG